MEQPHIEKEGERMNKTIHDLMKGIFPTGSWESAGGSLPWRIDQVTVTPHQHLKAVKLASVFQGISGSRCFQRGNDPLNPL